MSKKRNFYIEYTRIVNGEEYSQKCTISGKPSKEAAIEKLNMLCKSAGGTEPVITLIQEVR